MRSGSGRRIASSKGPGALGTFRGVDVGMKNEHFFDLRSDRHRRVERGHWLLEDHRDVAPANGAELLSPASDTRSVVAEQDTCRPRP